MKVAGYAQLWLPWPFQNRNLFAMGSIIDMLDEHGFFAVIVDQIDMESVAADSADPTAFMSDMNAYLDGGLLLGLQRSGVILTPVISESGTVTSCTVSIIGFVDPGISGIPDALINFVGKVMAPVIIHQVKHILHQISTNPNSPYRKRISESPETYLALEEAVRRFATSKNRNQQQATASV
eukprot:c4393_g1_i2.p1 GENE.c4393_g1_i2~~c4393_g1_i2.p1  ORF type:complete len:195 (+),score=40.85 c4393_g1_i2:44-586(+)